MAEIKYPEQVISVARSDKTLGVDAKLSVADTEHGQSPLELHAGYSRFVFTILTQSASGYNFVSANLPPAEIDLIKKETDIAVEMLTNKALEKKPSVSSAYEVTFFTGEFRGKTAADVLLQDASKESALLTLKKQLEANLSKYPRNKAQIDAIDEAIALLKAGKLTAEGVKSSIIDIYRADIRAPHASKKDAEGNTDVYSFSIVCDLSKNYPFAINIMNCKAPVVLNANGTQTPNMAKAKDKKEANILLTKSEWYKIIQKMIKVNKMFEEMNFEKLYKIAKDNTYQAKNNKTT